MRGARPSLRYPGWRVVAGAFVVASCGWGFGFYGLGVYLATLHDARGWPIARLAAAITAYQLFGALLVVWVGAAIEKAGARAVVTAGACATALALGGMAGVKSLWALHLWLGFLAIGWATMSSAAVTAIVAPWFDANRGAALSLALTGASVGGVAITPALVLAIAHFGHSQALPVAALVMLAVLLPIVWTQLLPSPASIGLVVEAEPGAGDATQRARRRQRVATSRAVAGGPTPPATPVPARLSILASVHFWTIAGPFALGLIAQVGVLTHQIAMVQPLVGAEGAALAVGLTTVAAIVGRLAIGWGADRVDRRRIAAASFALQAFALIPLVGWQAPWAVYVASCGFGLGVGNMITLPGLIVQREYGLAEFSRVVGLVFGVAQVLYAFGPALVGVLRDQAGSYRAPLGACALLITVAAILVLLRPAGAGKLRDAGASV